MDNEQTAWVVLADVQRARLLRCTMVAGRCRAEEVDEARSDAPRHEHEINGPIWKATSVSFGIEKDETVEHARSFARQVAVWIERHMLRRDIGELSLFAPPGFLGALRNVLPASVRKRMREIDRDFVNFPSHVLAAHKTIRRLVGPGGA